MKHVVAIEAVDAVEVVVVLVASKLVGVVEVVKLYRVLRWVKQLVAESRQFSCWASEFVGLLGHLKWLKYSRQSRP